MAMEPMGMEMGQKRRNAVGEGMMMFGDWGLIVIKKVVVCGVVLNVEFK